MNSASLLIVDDEANIRLVLRTALQSEGYAIREAANGNQALQAVAQAKPDVIVLDLRMPELDGMGVLEKLREMPADQRPRVIVLTAYGSIAKAVQATRLGALDFLEKPASPTEVRQAVAAALKQEIEPAADWGGGYVAVLDRVRKALRLAKYADAETLLMKATDLAMGDAPYFNLLGILYESRRQWRLARKLYGKAIGIDKHYEPALHNLRRLYQLETTGRAQEPVTLGDEMDIWFARLPDSCT